MATPLTPITVGGLGFASISTWNGKAWAVPSSGTDVVAVDFSTLLPTTHALSQATTATLAATIDSSGVLHLIQISGAWERINLDTFDVEEYANLGGGMVGANAVQYGLDVFVPIQPSTSAIARLTETVVEVRDPIVAATSGFSASVSVGDTACFFDTQTSKSVVRVDHSSLNASLPVALAWAQDATAVFAHELLVYAAGRGSLELLSFDPASTAQGLSFLPVSADWDTAIVGPHGRPYISANTALVTTEPDNRRRASRSSGTATVRGGRG